MIKNHAGVKNMKRYFKLFATILLVILGGLSILPISVSADREEAEVGDKLYFMGKEWIILDMNSTRWLVYLNGNSGSGYWNTAPETYIGSNQDSNFVSLQNVLHSNYPNEYENMVINKFQPNEWYNHTSFSSSGGDYRKLYGIGSTEYCTYIHGRGFAEALNTGNSLGCGTDGRATLTRVGHHTSRSAYNRPVYYDGTGPSGIKCNGYSTVTTWTLRGAKNSSGQSVNYFAIPSNTTKEFTVAGSTPGGEYTLDIEQKYTVSS